MTSIHGFESEDIAKESSICLGVLAVDNYVSTRNHFPLLEKVGNPYQVAQRNQVNRPAATGVRQVEGSYRRVRLKAWLGRAQLCGFATCGPTWSSTSTKASISAAATSAVNDAD